MVVENLYSSFVDKYYGNGGNLKKGKYLKSVGTVFTKLSLQLDTILEPEDLKLPKTIRTLCSRDWQHF